MLKLEPKKPTTNNIKGYIQYVNHMTALSQKINIGIDFIAPARIEQLRDKAMAADTDDIQEMRPVKRYALVAIFIYLLNYINDPEMRRRIQAATCKSEEFNQFISWIRFGSGGVISDNMRLNQHKIIRFSHLLANILIFHTVVYQTKAINKLREQGIEIPDEILSGISPYWTEHLNRFGVFQLDMHKIMPEIEYDLKK